MLLKIKIDKPKHGWIPISINYEDFELAFEASDVPNNCINELAGSIILASNKIDTSTNFHLEPDWYIFNFIIQNDIYRLKILEKEESTIKEIIKIDGSFNEIIIPFQRELKKVFTFEFNEPDWPELDQKKLDKLNVLLKENKKS